MKVDAGGLRVQLLNYHQLHAICAQLGLPLVPAILC